MTNAPGPKEVGHNHNGIPIENAAGTTICHQCSYCLELVVACFCNGPKVPQWHLADGERHTKCPMCGTWHWRPRSENCSDRCSAKAAKDLKRGQGEMRR